MKYTKKQLNSKVYGKKVVCKIDNMEQWSILKEVCPDISDYNEQFMFYLCPNSGKSDSNDSYENNEYIKVSFSELFTLDYEIY